MTFAPVSPPGQIVIEFSAKSAARVVNRGVICNWKAGETM